MDDEHRRTQREREKGKDKVKSKKKSRTIAYLSSVERKREKGKKKDGEGTCISKQGEAESICDCVSAYVSSLVSRSACVQQREQHSDELSLSKGVAKRARNWDLWGRRLRLCHDCDIKTDIRYRHGCSGGSDRVRR